MIDSAMNKMTISEFDKIYPKFHWGLRCNEKYIGRTAKHIRSLTSQSGTDYPQYSNGILNISMSKPEKQT